jgi:hypothetical protein
MIRQFKQLDRILRGEATRLPALRDGIIDISARGLFGILLLLGLLYGICMGLFSVINSHAHDYRQLLATTIKVPALFFLTILVTFPSLYVFNALVGSRLTLLSVLRLLVASLGVMLAVLASFGTIVAFFSASTTSYPFMVLLNVVVFAASGFLGLLFLFQTLHRLTLVQEEPLSPTPVIPVEPSESTPTDQPILPPPLPPSALDRIEGRILGSHVKAIFRIWVIVFGLVGAQMGWILRPFIGRPGLPFSFFRERGSNFFEAVFNQIHNLLSW